MKLGALALAIVGFGTAQAVFKVPDVAIERALNGQSINVRFEQTSARLVELRVNGMSVGTRAVDGSLTNTTTFRIDASMLNEGANRVEALIFDADGKLLDKQTNSVDVEAPVDSPVIILTPKAGETVQGLVEIRVGVKNQIRPKMVSFIVDGDMRSMSNVAPYTYVIDTEMLPNGWHEIQVLAVDDRNVSIRSRKVRVFVNNPGGRTERVMPTVAVVAVPPVNLTSMSGAYSALVTKPSQAKPMNVAAPKAVTNGARNLTRTGKRVVKPVVKPVAKPVVKPVAKPIAKPVVKPVAKPVRTLPAVTKPVQVAPIKAVNSAASTVRVTQGTRLNLNGVLTLSYNARPLNFDVQPRVQSGIALSPFRHLYEAAGGKVMWTNTTKTVDAKGAANNATIRIGSTRAMLNGQRTTLEYAAFLDRGRTVVPLSFISDTLNVNVDVDQKTGHVLITSRK